MERDWRESKLEFTVILFTTTVRPNELPSILQNFCNHWNSLQYPEKWDLLFISFREDRREIVFLGHSNEETNMNRILSYFMRMGLKDKFTFTQKPSSEFSEELLFFLSETKDSNIMNLPIQNIFYISTAKEHRCGVAIPGTELIISSRGDSYTAKFGSAQDAHGEMLNQFEKPMSSGTYYPVRISVKDILVLFDVESIRDLPLQDKAASLYLLGSAGVNFGNISLAIAAMSPNLPEAQMKRKPLRYLLSKERSTDNYDPNDKLTDFLRSSPFYALTPNPFLPHLLCSFSSGENLIKFQSDVTTFLMKMCQSVEVSFSPENLKLGPPKSVERIKSKLEDYAAETLLGSSNEMYRCMKDLFRASYIVDDPDGGQKIVDALASQPECISCKSTSQGYCAIYFTLNLDGLVGELQVTTSDHWGSDHHVYEFKRIKTLESLRKFCIRGIMSQTKK